MLRTTLSAATAALAVAALGGCPVDPCECQVCFAGQAVTITVSDEDGTPLTDWLLDATVNGQPVDDAPCAPENRATNTCNFGSDLGVYNIVVRAPGFEDKEVVVRAAAQSGQNCCAQCVNNALLTVFMVREPQ